MADIKTFDQGSKILQNVDVSSIVTGLALGIASAQERLDNNSVSQLIRLADTKVSGKSLLEFGFQPAFYAFDYADISASIQLKMAVKEEVEVDFSLSVDYKNNTTFNKGFFDQLKKNKQNSLSKNSKTQKNVALRAKTSKNISVNEKSFKIHEEEGSLSKIEKAEEKMRDQSEELRVETIIEDKQELTQTTNSNNVFIRKEDGYVVIVEPEVHTEVTALLKMKQNYSGTAVPITLNNKSTPDTFNKVTDFPTSLTNAVAGNDDTGFNGEIVVGINNVGIHRDNKVIPYVFYFDWDKYKKADFSYSQNVETNSLSLSDIKLLALALKEDSSLKIKIKGYTDGSGKPDYNNPLGKRRAETLKTELENHAKKSLDAQIETESFGESLATDESKQPTLRKVIIEFNTPILSDYIYFKGGNIKTTAVDTTDDLFIMKNASATVGTRPNITFSYGGTAVSFVQGSSQDLSASSLTSSNHYKHKFYIEKYNEAYYLLHEEAMIHYVIHSKESKEVDVKVENEALAEMNKETTKVFVSETQNDLSKLKQSSKDFEGDRSLAISGSLDVRYARQFGVSVEGNASVSARMISVPPPTGLENYIQTLSGNSNNNSGN
ncbi:OmpA family protein [Tenacibaculum sp.]|nr:OmpA family protein [Tenacibaculum sp.]